MAEFLAAYKKTGQSEGGYANVASDPGGETYAGITMRDFPNWPGWAKLAKYKPLRHGQIVNDPAIESDKRMFYKSNFWNPVQGDLLDSQRLAEKLYDMAVLTGQGTAIKILQRSLNALNKQGRLFPDVAVDGKMSSRGETLAATNGYDNQDVLFKVVNALHGSYLIERTEKNKKLEDFTEGWFNLRIASVLGDERSMENMA